MQASTPTDAVDRTAADADASRISIPSLVPLLVATVLAWQIPGEATALLTTIVMYATLFGSALLRPEQTAAAFVFSLPAETVAAPLRLVPGLNFQTLAIGAFILAAIIDRGRQPRPRPPNRLLYAVACFALVLLASALHAGLYGTAELHDWTRGWRTLPLGELLSLWKNQVFYMFLAPLSFALLWRRADVQRTVLAVAWMTLFIAVQAVVQMRQTPLIDDDLPYQRAGGMLFNQPNSLGGFLALMLVALVPLLFERLSVMRRLAVIGAVAAGAVALALTFSRSAWGATLGGLAVAATLRRGWTLVAVAVVGMSFPLWLPESVTERLAETIRPPRVALGQSVELDNSAQTRLDQWTALPGMWSRAPLFGHGYQSYPRLWGVVRPSGYAQTAHSSIIEITVEQGLLGLGAYVWCIVLLALAGWRLRSVSDDPLDRALGIGFVAAIAALVLLDSVGARFRNGDLMAYTWVLGGALARLGLELTRPGSSWNRTGPRFRVLDRSPRLTPGASPASPADPSA